MARGIPPDDKRCTAMSKRTRKRCGRPAIKGKDKCKFHGGASPIKHGKYSKYKNAHPELKARIDAYLKDREEMLNIENSIAVLRSITDLVMEKLVQTDTLTKKDVTPLVDLLVKTEKETVTAIEKLHKIMHGETHTIKLESVQLLLQQVVDVINEEVPDERVRQRIAVKLQKLRS